MKTYKEVEQIVKNNLTDKRFHHSVCTMERAVEYAKIYGEDEEKIKLIGISHDVAKQFSKEKINEYIKKYNIELDEMEKETLDLSHSKIGAIIAQEEFGFDKQMAEAIAFHTTGKENMTLMQKIIFVADFTGEDRNLENTNKVYELAKKDINMALLEILKGTVKYILEKNKKIHLNTIKAYNYYLKK